MVRKNKKKGRLKIRAKKGQLKIQEMAFMLVGVVIFFALVGMFVMSIVYLNLYDERNRIAKERTLSSLTNIADTPELSCASSKTNCVDSDKLIALVRNENYKNLFPYSSLRIIRFRGFEKSESELVECNLNNYLSCSGDLNEKRPAYCTDVPVQTFSGTVMPSAGAVSEDKRISFSTKKGPFRHTPGKTPGGTASAPKLALSNLEEGEEIRMANIKGTINYQAGYFSSCRNGKEGIYGFPAKAGFYNSNNKLVGEERNLKAFESGIKVPAGATKLYVYILEGPNSLRWYHDNDGTCSFDIQRFDPSGEEDYSEYFEEEVEEVCVPGDFEFGACEPDCDAFVVYDNEVENEVVISSFVALCRKEYENNHVYDKCEVAKLVAGTELKIVEDLP